MTRLGVRTELCEKLGIRHTQVAAHYKDIVDGFVLDSRDSDFVAEIEASGIQTLTTDIVMSTLDDRCRLACEVNRFASRIANNDCPPANKRDR